LILILLVVATIISMAIMVFFNGIWK
jgi:hypothetical protein